tara:strand:+ start:562 stop:819 length:258 start_codon:yes stop_codon:yes gene_type:complete
MMVIGAARTGTRTEVHHTAFSLCTGQHRDARSHLLGHLSAVTGRALHISTVAMGESLEALTAFVTTVIEVWHLLFLSPGESAWDG